MFWKFLAVLTVAAGLLLVLPGSAAAFCDQPEWCWIYLGSGLGPDHSWGGGLPLVMM